MTAEERIEAALEIAFSEAGYDGSHHKAECIDHMVRALLGDNYEKWVKAYEGEEYTWPTGYNT